MATEQRQIDADDALKYAIYLEGILAVPAFCIENAPTVDAVEVVRCRDCVHSFWDEENEMWKCVESAEYDSDIGDYIGFVEYHNEDFFCAFGERKTDHD